MQVSHRQQVQDYTTLNMSVRPIRDKWNWATPVRNLFNAVVREPSRASKLIPGDLPMAPRSLYVQAILTT